MPKKKACFLVFVVGLFFIQIISRGCFLGVGRSDGFCFGSPLVYISLFWFCWVFFSVHICFKTQFYLFIFFLLQFVADGVFFAELNELLTRELAEDGYSGVEVRVTPMRTEIIIRATRTQNVLGMISAHF